MATFADGKLEAFAGSTRRGAPDALEEREDRVVLLVARPWGNMRSKGVKVGGHDSHRLARTSKPGSASIASML